MKDLLSRLQPYVALVSAVCSLAVLTYLIQLLNLIRGAFSEQVNAVQEQKSVAEAHLTQMQEDLTRTEKWHQREIGTLQQKLAALLGSENITIEKLVATGGHLDLGEEIKQAVNSVLRELSRRAISFLRESWLLPTQYTSPAATP